MKNSTADENKRKHPLRNLRMNFIVNKIAILSFGILISSCSDSQPTILAKNNQTLEINGWSRFSPNISIDNNCIFSTGIIVCGEYYSRPDSLNVWKKTGAQIGKTVAWNSDDTTLSILNVTKEKKEYTDSTTEYEEAHYNFKSKIWTFSKCTLFEYMNSLGGVNRAKYNSFAFVNNRLMLVRETPRSFLGDIYSDYIFIETYIKNDSGWLTVDTTSLRISWGWPKQWFLYNSRIVTGKGYYCLEAGPEIDGQGGEKIYCYLSAGNWIASPKNFVLIPAGYEPRHSEPNGTLISNSYPAVTWNPISNTAQKINDSIASIGQAMFPALNQSDYNMYLLSNDAISLYGSDLNFHRILNYNIAIYGMRLYFSDTVAIAIPGKGNSQYPNIYTYPTLLK